MSQQRFKSKTYRFQPYDSFNSYSSSDIRTSIIDSQLNLQNNNFNLYPLQNFQNSLNLNVAPLPAPLPIWRPSTRLNKLHSQFKNTILCQHICLPCAFCGKLLYPAKAKWIPYDENYTYPLEINFQNINIYIRGEDSSRTTCVCESCKRNQKRYPCPKLHPIPDQIKAIPATQRRFLSPVFLHCSLGRNLDANRYTEYRTLVGDMEFSKNMRALKLYSGILGAFLTNPENQNNNENLSWLTPQLCTAAHWLKQHNKYLSPFSRLISTSSLLSETHYDPFPTAMHLPSDTNAPPFQEGDIILSSADFPTEVHNEDFHYTHLMAGFVHTPTTTLPLSFDNPDLEPLIFPDLFPDGNGHFYDQNINSSEDDSIKIETYGKYIKHRLEKLRNHQNTMRLWRQKQSDRILRPPTASELITHSVYSGKPETKWSHLKDILRSTDNRDTNPTNRPLHTTHHFTHRKKELWNHVWRKPANNPNLEPELYQLVLTHQIHTCGPGKCNGPALPGQVCKKKFPRPYSPTTYYNTDEQRYIYRCVTEKDRWNLHMCLTYQEGDKYHEHIIARRLSSIECMFLLLGETICNSSVSDDEEDPYWKDTVEKYFATPIHAEQVNHNITLIPDITSSPLVVRYRLSESSKWRIPFFITIITYNTHADLKMPHCLIIICLYREKYLSLHPDFQNSIPKYTIQQKMKVDIHYRIIQHIITQIIENLTNNITHQIADILTRQLDILKLTLQYFHKMQCFYLPEEQYILYNTIISNLWTTTI
ncbi:unnamed protein product [Rhizophagus irregularis]|nr:unnamed protein product [Rhizophagus irregularis]